MDNVHAAATAATAAAATAIAADAGAGAASTVIGPDAECGLTYKSPGGDAETQDLQKAIRDDPDFSPHVENEALYLYKVVLSHLLLHHRAGYLRCLFSVVNWTWSRTTHSINLLWHGLRLARR